MKPPTAIDPAEATRLGRLGEQSVHRAMDLACMVREEPRDVIGRYLRKLDDEQTRALIVALAALVPVDQPVNDLLAWVTWDEHGRPLAGADVQLPPAGEEPDEPFGLKPCGTYAAWARHVANGEPVDEACEQAKKDYWRTRAAERRGREHPPLPKSRAARAKQAASATRSGHTPGQEGVPDAA